MIAKPPPQGAQVNQYLRKHQLVPVQIEIAPDPELGCVVVIPCRDEPEKIAADLLKLLQDDELRSMIGIEAQAFVKENYTWEAVCERMEVIYRKTVTDHTTNR